MCSPRLWRVHWSPIHCSLFRTNYANQAAFQRAMAMIEGPHSVVQAKWHELAQLCLERDSTNYCSRRGWERV